MALLINPYRFASFDPSSLFGGGDDGVFLDFQIGRSPMYTDQSGTTAVDADNDYVLHAKSLAPTTTDNFARATDAYFYKTGTVPYLNFPSNNSALVSSSFDGSFLGSKAGSTFCCAGYYTGTGETSPLFYGGGANDTYFWVNGGVWQFTAKKGGVWYDATDSVTRADAWYVFTGIADIANGSVIFRVNGTQVDTTAIPSGTYGTSGGETMQLGATWVSGAGGVRVAANFAINRVLSAGELNSLESWMQARVGI